MALVPYRRGKNWSSAYALKRIEAKRQALAKRREEIAQQVAKFRVEEARIADLEAQLATAHEAETRQVESRRGKPLLQGSSKIAEDGSDDGEPVLSAGDRQGRSLGATNRRIEPETTVVGSAVVSCAGHGGSIDRYDAARCLFLGSGGFRGGSTAVPSVDRSDPMFDDPLLVRALRMIETPGLVHAMVLAERTQSVVDVFSYDVPQEALGLPMCEAYAAHCFSVDALRKLVDPDQRVEFLALLTTSVEEPTS